MTIDSIAKGSHQGHEKNIKAEKKGLQWQPVELPQGKGKVLYIFYVIVNTSGNISVKTEFSGNIFSISLPHYCI